MPCEELDIVGITLKPKPGFSDCEPMLASFNHARYSSTKNLGSALSYMLANAGSPIMPAIAIREVVEEAYAADPEMIASAAAIFRRRETRDPAVDKYSTPALPERVPRAAGLSYRPLAMESGASGAGDLPAKSGFRIVRWISTWRRRLVADHA